MVLRPIRPEDADGLIDFHDNLSVESRYFRFFGPKPTLSRKEAEYLAGVDFTDRFAIVALSTDDDRIVAVGRFDVVAPATAEPAIVVRDDYQKTGLGTAILERMLEVARGRGIRQFAGEVLGENEPMLALLRQNGLHVGTPHDGVVLVTAEVEDGSPLVWAFRTLAPQAGRIVRTIARVLEERSSDDQPN